MKIRHNKKRNTAFVYEALIVEATVAILKKDTNRQTKALNIIKRHFKPGSALKKDLECYRSLCENQNLNVDTSRRIINEARLQRRMVGEKGLFANQTQIIHDINKELSPIFVIPPPPIVPVFIVVYSLIIFPLPIVTLVFSPLYFKSCGSLPIEAKGKILLPFPIEV